MLTEDLLLQFTVMPTIFLVVDRTELSEFGLELTRNCSFSLMVSYS